LAKGLFNAIVHAGADVTRAEQLLGRLQTLADRKPDDAAVREQLAKGLFNAFNNAGADVTRAEQLLGRLQTLADRNPDDAAVREPLAMGLYNAFNNAGADVTRAEQLLGRLQTLADSHPAEVSLQLAAFRACVVGFYASIQVGAPRTELIRLAAMRVPALPLTTEARDLARALVSIVTSASDSLEGEAKNAMDHAGSTLSAACEAKFG